MFRSLNGKPVKTGTTCLQAWFSEDKDKRNLGAEFVTIKRLGPADPAAVSKYRASDPDRILKE